MTLQRSEIESRTIRAIAEQMGAKLEEVTINTHLSDDLGADSLDQIEIVMALEEEFEIEIPDADFDTEADSWTVAKVCDVVEKRL